MLSIYMLLFGITIICLNNVISIISPVKSLTSREVRIGALFSTSSAEDKQQQATILQATINDINSYHSNSPLKLDAKIENVSRDDLLDADAKACSILGSGVVAIVGPISGPASQHIQAICDSLEVPYIEIQPNLVLRQADLAIYLHPTYDSMADAYIDLIRVWNWTSFAIVYESSDAIIRLQDLFKEQNNAALQRHRASYAAKLSSNTGNQTTKASSVSSLPIASKAKRWTVKLFQFKMGSNYREVFWQIKKSGENNIVLDVSRENLPEALKQAQQVGLITEKQSYLITSLDLQSVDLTDFMYSKTKVTSLELTDSSSRLYEKVNKFLSQQHQQHQQKHPTSDNINYTTPKAQTQVPILSQTALIHDAIHLLLNSIKELDNGSSIRGQSLSCESIDKTWQHGSSIINYMRSTSFKGLTGNIAFDQTGRRSNFLFNIMSLTDKGLKKIGVWNESVGVQIESGVFQKMYVDETDSMDLLTVTAKRTKPYFMLKQAPIKQEGNDRFEGYAVDLIHELSQIVGFQYKFKEVDDFKYGAAEDLGNGSVRWNGMIGEVISGRADLAISDLTITASRETAVDFTHPFMGTGISILFKKPANKVTTLFSFLSPFSLDVWFYVLAAYTGVSLIMFICGRISPYEWTNPYPCPQQEMVLHNNFSVLNSFWFTIGSLMQQGSDLAPKSMATRTIAGIWYFFTLIMISSYTANLAAFLTVEKVVYPIENVKDLSEQTEIKYGCVESGTTRTFFKDSHIETYQKIYKFMEEHNTYVRSNDEGRERVEQGNFAFFMESTSIEYITERNCNLTQLGSPLDSKGYGIATSKTSRYKRPYRDLLSSGVLKLQENGMLHVLKNRWWKEKDGVSSCSDDNKGGLVRELSLANVGGVFVVLLGGMGISFVIALFESLYRMSFKDRDSMCDQMMKDLIFAVSCQSSTKPAKRKRRTLIG